MLLSKELIEKIDCCEALSKEELQSLFLCQDLLLLGKLAFKRKEKFNGSDLVFSRSNFLDCPSFVLSSSELRPQNKLRAFCDKVTFLSKSSREGIEEVFVDESWFTGMNFETWLEMISLLRSTYPDSSLRALTAEKVFTLSQEEKISVKEVFSSLKNSGLNSISGADAGLLSSRIREHMSRKTNCDEWLNIHRVAHQEGIGSSVFMSYGHVEEDQDKIEHLVKVRDLQSETEGFQFFSPFFLKEKTFFPSVLEDFKTTAIARIFLHNMRHIRVSSLLYGLDFSALSSFFGASHIGSVRQIPSSEEEDFFPPLSQVDKTITKTKRPFLLDSSAESFLQDGEMEPSKILESEENFILFSQKHTWISLLRLVEKRRSHRSKSLSAGVSLGVDLRTPLHKIKEDFLMYRDSYPSLFIKVNLVPLSKRKEDPLVVWDELRGFLSLLRVNLPEATFSLSGFHFLWEVSQLKELPLSQIFLELREKGASLIETSPFESDGGVRNSELISLHEEASRAGLPSIARMELSAQFDGSGLLIKPLYSRIKKFLTLPKKASHLKGFKIEIPSEASSSLQEYCFAVALIRYFFQDVFEEYPLSLNLERVPLFSGNEDILRQLGCYERLEMESLKLKLPALLSLLGAKDLGAFEVRDLAFLETLLMGNSLELRGPHI